MWPFKKKKGTMLSAGGSIELEFATTWKYDRREVVIMTDHGPITLNEKSEFFIEITADNVDPVKIKVVPDFKNRELNFIEIIDPNIKPTTDKNKGKITFVGTNVSKDTNISVGEYLKRWDENIEKMGNIIKKHERRKHTFTVMNIIIIFINAYIFVITKESLRYINLFAIIISGYAIYHLWITNKKLRKDYDKYKELREKSFEIVKEK